MPNGGGGAVGIAPPPAATSAAAAAPYGGKDSTTSIHGGVAVTVTAAPVLRHTKPARRTPPPSAASAPTGGLGSYGGSAGGVLSSSGGLHAVGIDALPSSASVPLPSSVQQTRPKSPRQLLQQQQPSPHLLLQQPSQQQLREQEDREQEAREREGRDQGDRGDQDAADDDDDDNFEADKEYRATKTWSVRELQLLWELKTNQPDLPPNRVAELMWKATGIRKTGDQCRTRWTKVDNPSITKGAWSQHEDELLYKAVNEMTKEDSPPPWVAISEACFKGKRTSKQCRARFMNHLDPGLRH
ncbi:unnamed protein product, partial [Ectocarpus sp. 8 AP-2014]